MSCWVRDIISSLFVSNEKNHHHGTSTVVDLGLKCYWNGGIVNPIEGWQFDEYLLNLQENLFSSSLSHIAMTKRGLQQWKKFGFRTWVTLDKGMDHMKVAAAENSCGSHCQHRCTPVLFRTFLVRWQTRLWTLAWDIFQDFQDTVQC